MTDADLIRLLSEKTPAEFSSTELALLRERVRISPEVRTAVESAVQFEGDLYTALTEIQISVDRVLERAAEQDKLQPVKRRAHLWWGLLGLTTCLLLVLLVARPGSDPAEIAPEDSPVVDRTDGSSGDMTSSAPPGKSVPLDEEVMGEAVARTTPPNTIVEPSGTSTSAPITAGPPETSLAHPSGPWDAWLLDGVQPLESTDPRVVGTLESLGIDQLTREVFEQWWAPVAGQPHAIKQEQIDRRAILQFEGWCQLRAPWVNDTRLRFAPFDQKEMTLYFWCGDEGVALKHYKEREPHMWAAFQIRRTPGNVQPNWWGLLTTDSGGVARSGGEVWDISIHEGQLRLSVAELTLLSAPIPQLPTQVLVEANSRIRGFSWLRAVPPTLLATPGRDSVLATENPSDWDWQLPDDGMTMLQREADGSVTLTSTSRSEIVRTYVDLPGPGLFETRFQVAHADPGTGVFLADSSGRPVTHLSFARDRISGRLAYRSVRPQEKLDTVDYQFRSFPPPYFIDGQWLQITTGLGICQTRCSGDGRFFGHAAENPLRDVDGNVARIGLFCWPGETPRTIRLQSARVGRLEGIYAITEGQPTKMIPESELSPEDVKKFQFGSSWWNAGWNFLAGKIPSTTFWDEWAIRTLELGPPRELATPLVKRLAKSARLRLSDQACWTALDDLASLQDLWHDQISADWSLEYAAVGSSSRRFEPGGSRAAWERWLTSPIWSYRGHRDPFLRRFADDTLRLTLDEQWQAAIELASVVQHWQAKTHPHYAPRDQAEVTNQLARWSKAIALEQIDLQNRGANEVLPVDWRHPLLLTVNKEAYNVHAEMQSALASRAFADACRIVSGLQPQAISGLLPDHTDKHLLVSLDVAMQLAVESTPELRDALRDQLTPTGTLQVRQAIASGRVSAVEAAALQYWGTLPGAMAHLWLGDRSMSLGDTLGAFLHYQASRRWSDSSLEHELGPRLELARHLSGLPTIGSGNDATNASLGGQAVSEVISVSRRAGFNWSTAEDSAATPATSLEAQGYELQKLGRFDGQSGQNAGRGEYRRSDAFGRQMAVALDQQRVYLGNRFQLNAYDRETGTRLWARGLGSEQGEAHAFPFVAMQPVLSGERVFVRSLTKAGVELACLNSSDGSVLWTTPPGEKSQILTDPIVLGNSVWAIVSRISDHEQLELNWSEFDAQTGSFRSSNPLLRVRDVWRGEIPATLTAVGAQLIATFPGIVLAFDLKGQVQWVRRETWLPHSIDPLSTNHWIRPAAIDQDRMYFSLPGGRSVYCLNLATGRLIWRNHINSLQGIVAVNEGLVLARTPTALVSIDTETGLSLWESSIEGLLGPVSISRESVWAMRELDRAPDRGWLQLVQLDRSSGESLAEIPWELPEAADWRFGPWWMVGDDVWALMGQGDKDPARDVVRLSPREGTHGDRWLEPQLAVWSPVWSPEAQRLVQLTLPGWQLFGVPEDRIRLEAGDVRGEEGVLVVRGEPNQTVRWVRSLPGEASSLKLRVGHEPNQACRWLVSCDGHVLLDETWPPDSADWKTLEVSLPPAEGLVRWVQVESRSVEGQGVVSCWKSLIWE